MAHDRCAAPASSRVKSQTVRATTCQLTIIISPNPATTTSIKTRQGNHSSTLKTGPVYCCTTYHSFDLVPTSHMSLYRPSHARAAQHAEANQQLHDTSRSPPPATTTDEPLRRSVAATKLYVQSWRIEALAVEKPLQTRRTTHWVLSVQTRVLMEAPGRRAPHLTKMRRLPHRDHHHHLGACVQPSNKWETPVNTLRATRWSYKRRLVRRTPWLQPRDHVRQARLPFGSSPEAAD